MGGPGSEDTFLSFLGRNFVIEKLLLELLVPSCFMKTFVVELKVDEFWSNLMILAGANLKHPDPNQFVSKQLLSPDSLTFL